MWELVKKLLVISVIFLSLDSIYLSQIAPVFKQMVSGITSGKEMKFDYIAAIKTYILLVFGLYYFIISPGRSLVDAFLYGIVVYGVYELTNKATLPGWKWSFVAVDTLWGGAVHTLVTYLYSIVNNMLL